LLACGLNAAVHCAVLRIDQETGKITALEENVDPATIKSDPTDHAPRHCRRSVNRIQNFVVGWLVYMRPTMHYFVCYLWHMFTTGMSYIYVWHAACQVDVQIHPMYSLQYTKTHTQTRTPAHIHRHSNTEYKRTEYSSNFRDAAGV
jgi:hypothetical protein